MATTRTPDPGDAAGGPSDPGAATDASADAAVSTAGTASATARARRTAGRGRIADPAAEAPRPRPAPRAAGTDVLTPRTVVWSGGEDSEPVLPDDTEAPARTSRAGRDLPAAIAVGLALGGLIIASLFVYRPSFAYIVGAAVIYGCWELTQALRTATIRLTFTPLAVGGAAMLAAAWLRGTNGLAVAALVTALGIVIWRIGDGAHGYTRDTAASVFVLLYVPLLAGFAVLLAHPDDGAARVIAFVATVVCSDTGGYAAGVLFGRHPLAPVVSKAKTWEGFLGSVLACSAAGVLFMIFTFHQEWWKGLLYGLAVVVTATLGDLGESMVKRDVGIKDMGRLLPGHGGVMDRLDSLLPCAAVAYLLLSAFAPV